MFSILPSMLGKAKRKKTSVQKVREFTDDITVKMSRISRRSFPVRAVCKVCIVIFSFSIGFGVYGLVSGRNDILKKEQNIGKLQNELQGLEAQLGKKQELVKELVSDSLAMEAVIRSYGMSRKGERIFYFLD